MITRVAFHDEVSPVQLISSLLQCHYYIFTMVTLTTPTCLVLFHLLLSSTSANPLKHTSHLAKRALELEDKSQGFKYYNWSTLRPSTAEDVEIHGIKMPKRVQVTSYDGTVDDDVWQPGTVFSYAQWSAITGYNETYHSLQKR